MNLAEPLQQVDRTYVRWKGRKLSYFAGCDYFRLGSDPKVLAAVKAGLAKYGLNVAASRLTTGNHRLYGELEASLEDFFGVASATLGSNGYMSNLIAAQALSGQYSHALLDERAHSSLADAAQLLNCPVLKFKHRDPAHLKDLLTRLRASKPVVLTDGLFAHDGSVAPLREYLKLLPPDGVIVVDDAHSAGILGVKGRGTPEFLGVPRKQIIQTITLSKAFGAYGGAVLASKQVRAAIVARSHVFIGNTPLPLPLANAALASVQLLKRKPGLRERLQKNAEFVKNDLRSHGISVSDNPAPVVPLIPKNPADSGRLRRALLAADVFPSFIKYPGGPESGYFRFVISSEHTRDQLQRLSGAIQAAA